jgi:hypothetical protein
LGVLALGDTLLGVLALGDTLLGVLALGDALLGVLAFGVVALDFLPDLGVILTATSTGVDTTEIVVLGETLLDFLPV